MAQMLRAPCAPTRAHSSRPLPHGSALAGGLHSSPVQQLRLATICSVAEAEAPTSSADVLVDRPSTSIPRQRSQPALLNQDIREGHYERDLVGLQSGKADSGQASIASVLPPVDATQSCDVTVVGAGPAGMYLAAQLGRRGLKVHLLGLDVPIVNNYGVWVDEYTALGFAHTLECTFPDAVCYFGEGKETRVGRPYGRVSRRKLREHLLQLCLEVGVRFSATEVVDIKVVEGGQSTQLVAKDGTVYKSKLVTLAAGSAAGRFLQYEEGAPVVAAQTAYGIEAEVEGYDEAYPRDMMLFMDFRRHHTGVHENSAQYIKAGKHPNAGEGAWGTSSESPSFLYAMPLGGNRVFLEETCLVAKPALPFAVLKRRLTRRLSAMGIKVKQIHEEEWSYIPVGGPLPLSSQLVTAFGAAANLVHPATGFSVSRSFREAPRVADELASTIRRGLPVAQASQQVWDKLWPLERRTQASFHVFGMELLATLDLAATNDFFNTFFRLPQFYWRGFLASTLSSTQLIAFALVTFVIAPFSIKYKLIEHMVTDPAGLYLWRAYKAEWDASQDRAVSTASAVAGVLLMSELMAQAAMASMQRA